MCKEWITYNHDYFAQTSNLLPKIVTLPSYYYLITLVCMDIVIYIMLTFIQQLQLNCQLHSSSSAGVDVWFNFFYSSQYNMYVAVNCNLNSSAVSQFAFFQTLSTHVNHMVHGQTIECGHFFASMVAILALQREGRDHRHCENIQYTIIVAKKAAGVEAVAESTAIFKCK